MNIEFLISQIEGDVLTDKSSRLIYATDASVYREIPRAVVLPKTKKDIITVITFAKAHKITLIPRTAGTSLSGQVVGNGIVLDVSRYFNKILELNVEESWVKVEPGVVLDELNMSLKKYGLFFGPETSTSNRCMIGGMVGNNSCGAHSLIYGSTREHTLEVKAILSDGSEVEFKSLTEEYFNEKCRLKTLEGEIYRNINEILSDTENKQRILKEFPNHRIKRRNTGYAIDVLLQDKPFNANGEDFNFCNLICGSEGTLAFITEIKLNLVKLPPPETGLLVIHFDSLEEVFEANLQALKKNPGAIELIDKYILNCTKTNIGLSKNRFFLEGEPAALLCVEFARDTKDEIEKVCHELIEALKKKKLGYAYPLLYGNDIQKVWQLRKAGLGLLSNIPGDAKPQAVIEDTAVLPEQLADYVREFELILLKYNLSCVYYAHIATGELHLRPVINLKTTEGNELFRSIADEVAKLVKKYNGSLSGEHGDGRLRGEFIERMIGSENYNILKKIKNTWDPHGVFNKGKITDTPAMNTFLRYVPGQETKDYETYFDFSESLGYIRMIEKCSGSGDCRKSEVIGGLMCPSYQATKDEFTTTRARANILREIMSNSERPFASKEVYEALDLCVSCKGCKSECPSNVDMAKLKAEFLQHYYTIHGVPLRSRLIAHYNRIQSFFSRFGSIYNAFVTNRYTSALIKKVLGFSQQRSLPRLSKQSLTTWIRKNKALINNNLNDDATDICLFVDEFTNYNDSHIGKKAILLLNQLGYRILFVNNKESGRTYISKGFLKLARKYAEYNVTIYQEMLSRNIPVIGIEPSAILTFRDEYPDLLRGNLKEVARKIAVNTYTFEEFIHKEHKEGRVQSKDFCSEKKEILFHGHCQQKVNSSSIFTKEILSIPENYSVTEIDSGCCGMAGSFGYEKEHYEVSMKIGELKLFPAVRKAGTNQCIVASGTSCRQQITDGTSRKVLHPVEILYEALGMGDVSV